MRAGRKVKASLYGSEALEELRRGEATDLEDLKRELLGKVAG